MRPWVAAILYAVLGAITFVVCFPLLWAISTSLKPKDEIFRWPPTLWPENITFDAYRELLFGGTVASAPGAGVPPSAYFLTWFGNSIVVSVGSTITSMNTKRSRMAKASRMASSRCSGRGCWARRPT